MSVCVYTITLYMLVSLLLFRVKEIVPLKRK